MEFAHHNFGPSKRCVSGQALKFISNRKNKNPIQHGHFKVKKTQSSFRSNNRRFALRFDTNSFSNTL
jgi:hypothetical protein